MIAATAGGAEPASADPVGWEGWSLHGQTTFIVQGYPAMRSPYQGAHSLPGSGQARETWTATAYLGRKLWEGGEVYFNPEVAQGFGLAGTFGLGGFSNGEAQKTGGDIPKFRAQRYFFRQTIGLGGETETVADDVNQVAGRRAIDRVTLTIGRIAIGDIFDTNSYAHDPRTDFMNWALWSSGAYDFPADLPGYTRGAVVELNRKHWALRAGIFQVPKGPGSDVLTFKTGGAIVEFEERHTWRNLPGAVRVGLFGNWALSGNYRDVLRAAQQSPYPDINDVMAASRRVRPKTGFYLNVEQSLGPDFGVFARASWNDGRNEIVSFTDIDRSLSGGVSVQGARWGRPQDKIGIGGAINGLSRQHRNFLAAGGLGLIIGDGGLTYGHETILEVFYAARLSDRSVVTLDYQFVANPAYNADRGPVSIFSARLRADF
jgi:high affinity Mn2+ porin